MEGFSIGDQRILALITLLSGFEMFLDRTCKKLLQSLARPFFRAAVLGYVSTKGWMRERSSGEILL